MAIKVFYHVYAASPEVEVLIRDMLEKVIFSGLYEAAEGVHCFLAGKRPGQAFDAARSCLESFGGRIRIEAMESREKSGERFTLLRMPAFVEPSDKILYLHAKGCTRIRKPEFPWIRDWISMMQYHLIAGHRNCVDHLDSHDVVGTDYHPGNDFTRGRPHFSGNFWWARGDYFLSLDAADMDGDYLGPEMFLFKKKPRFHSLRDSATNHYKDPYPYSRYLDRRGISSPT